MNSQATIQPRKTNYRINAASLPLPEGSGLASDLARQLFHSETLFVLAFFTLHVLLAPAFKQSVELATAHAVVTLLVGLWVASSSIRLHRVAIWGAYVAGSEVLWRMTKTPIPWEFGKYAIILVFLVAMVRAKQIKGSLAVFLYFACLLPSLVIPLANISTDILLDQISFNLSGPLALMTSLWFFSHVQLTTQQINRLYCALICPALGVGALALIGIVTAEKLMFYNDSNFASSGGYGPNQVSSILGLGALAALLWLLSKETPLMMRILLMILALYLLGQSAMTFSRTGLYLVAGGVLLAIPFMLQDKRVRLRLIGVLVLCFLAVWLFVLPKLDNFTQGTLTQRFSDTQGSGRESLMAEDWRIFTENPIFGVGPGQAKFHLHGTYGREGKSRVAAHNEFTRLLAEHGIWGILATLILMLLAFQHFRNASTAKGRALVLSMTFWSMGFLFATVVRIVAPCFIFGLTAARLVPPTSLASNSHEQSNC